MSASAHAFRALTRLPLPPPARQQLLVALGVPAAAAARAAAVSELSALPPADLPVLTAALLSPALGAQIGAALEALTGQPMAAVVLPPPPHPLGPHATFPPRVAEALGMLGRTVDGLTRALPGVRACPGVMDFRDALRLPPPQRAVVVGAGYVGAELAMGWAGMNIPVTLLDRRPELLRGFIPDRARQVHRALVAAGVSVQLGHNVTRFRARAGGVVVFGRQTVGESPQLTGPERSWRADRVVIAAGVIRPG